MKWVIPIKQLAAFALTVCWTVRSMGTFAIFLFVLFTLKAPRFNSSNKLLILLIKYKKLISNFNNALKVIRSNTESEINIYKLYVLYITFSSFPIGHCRVESLNFRYSSINWFNFGIIFSAPWGFVG